MPLSFYYINGGVFGLAIVICFLLLCGGQRRHALIFSMSFLVVWAPITLSRIFQ